MIIQNGVGITTLLNGEAVKQALSAANETLAKGVYDPTTLSAVDADLQAANIKLAENIFGFVGTLAPGALAEDVEGDDVAAESTSTSATFYEGTIISIDVGAEETLVSKALTFDANSLTFAAAFANCKQSSGVRRHKLRLYMGGVLMQTSLELDPTHSLNYVLRDFKALSGAQTCELKGWNFEGSGGTHIKHYGASINSECAVAIAVGSVKLA